MDGSAARLTQPRGEHVQPLLTDLLEGHVEVLRDSGVVHILHGPELGVRDQRASREVVGAGLPERASDVPGQISIAKIAVHITQRRVG